jgi:hypothetical protein
VSKATACPERAASSTLSCSEQMLERIMSLRSRTRVRERLQFIIRGHFCGEKER